MQRFFFYHQLKNYPNTIISLLGQTWTMTILHLILQARDFENRNEISLTDFYQKIPFMEVEGMDGETGADKQPPLLCGIIKPEILHFLV